MKLRKENQEIKSPSKKTQDRNKKAVERTNAHVQRGHSERARSKYNKDKILGKNAMTQEAEVFGNKVLAIRTKKKSEMEKIGLEAVAVSVPKAKNANAPRLLSAREVAAMADSLMVGTHPFLVKQALSTICKTFQRDLIPETVNACMAGSIAEPLKPLGTLSTVFVGDADYLAALNPSKVLGDMKVGFTPKVIYNLTPDAGLAVAPYNDIACRKMHNKLIPLGGQHQLKGHRQGAKVAPYVNALRPNMATWLYAISPVSFSSSQQTNIPVFNGIPHKSNTYCTIYSIY